MNLTKPRDVGNVLAALSQGSHRAGTLKLEVLEGIISLLPSRDIYSVETGCGKSTVAFSNIAHRHLSFCYDDRNEEQSSVDYVIRHPHFVAERTTFVFGPTQLTLPRHEFGDTVQFDLALIDGPHGFPFPDLEYWHLYPRLAPGGLLVIDDLMIPSIGRMYDILREDRMFEEVTVLSTTGILRRTDEPSLPRDGDHWWEQGYNFQRFPVTMLPYRKDSDYSFGSDLDFTSATICGRYCIRGFEHRGHQGAATIDTSAILRLKCDKSTAGALRIRLGFRVASPGDCAGASIHANGTFITSIPACPGDVDVEFSCPARPDNECRVEFRLPAAKPVHDTRHNFDFRRQGFVLRQICVRDDDHGEAGILFHAGGPVGIESATQPAVGSSESPALSAEDFLAALDRISDVLGITSREVANPKEIVPPPILCPSRSSPVRFLPIGGLRPDAQPARSSPMLRLNGTRWTFVDFFAFEGIDFSFAVLRSLLHRAPNKKQVQMGFGGMAEKLALVLEADYQARRIGLGKFKDIPVARALYPLWRVLDQHKLARLAKPVMWLMEKAAQSANKANRRHLRERRFLLQILGALSDKGRSS